MKKGNKNDILAEGMKRFQQILEYTTINGLVDEADDDNAEDNGGADGGIPPMSDGNGGMPPMDGGNGTDMGGGMPPMQGGAPDMGGNGMPPMGGNDPDMMGGEGMAQTPQGFDPQGNGMGGAEEMDTTMQPDDEVVDITELTDKQDETEEEVLKINDKFDKVMKAIGHFEELIRTQNSNIDNLKAEFEKRNPTQVEKLSMQTSKSYPFSITPNDYWSQKEATSNYRTEGDDNGKEQGQYVITRNDVDGAVDWKGISDSLNDDDFMYNQTLNRVLGR